MLVPIILRMLARFEGIPQKTGVELSLMNRFFVFQVIVSASCAVLVIFLTRVYQNGFLVVTFASGIITALPGLVNHPTGVPTLLAQKLPQSSTFFLT